MILDYARILWVFHKFQILSHDDIPKEFFESFDRYSGVLEYPVGDAKNCDTIYCFDVYGKYDRSRYGQSRWDLIIHLNNQCKLFLEKYDV